MRILYVGKHKAENQKDVYEYAPWAKIIIELEQGDGFMAFESLAALHSWDGSEPEN